MAGQDTLTTLDTFLPYVDLSRQMGWDYALADAMWDQMTDASGQKITVERLAAETSKRGVGLWVWINSGGPNSVNPNTPRDVISDPVSRDAYFARLERAGVKGVKVDIWESDKQDLLAQQREVVRAAADHHLMVVLHNATVPRGMGREFPNLLSYEAAVTEGGYQGSSQTNRTRQPQNAQIMLFNRVIQGPTDYSPAILADNLNPKGPRTSSAGQQVALAVAMQSGLISYGSTPDSYLTQPKAVRDFLRDIPTRWDEVRYLGGLPGQDAVLARRAGDTWYVAGVNGKTLFTPTADSTTSAGYTPPVGIAQTMIADLAPLGCTKTADVTLIHEGEGDTAHNTLRADRIHPDRRGRVAVETTHFGGFAATVTGCANMSNDK